MNKQHISNFKIIMQKHNITQFMISQHLGCSQSLISLWSNGKCEPSLNAVITISENFNIPIEEIVLSFKKETI